jgi:hypothetical protein
MSAIIVVELLPKELKAEAPGTAAAVVLAGVPVMAGMIELATGAAWPRKVPICDKKEGLTAEVAGAPGVLDSVVMTGAVF